MADPNFDLLTEIDIAALLQNQRKRAPARKSYPGARRAAVLIPLVKGAAGWDVLFIRRTESVAEHKGQVAFPGGAVEPEDEGIEATALRETCEEIGLASERVQILGRLPDFYTITDYLVTPVVGRVCTPFELIISEDEVSRAFTIPLRWLGDPANYEERPWQRPNGRQAQVIFFTPYDGELLWGATARIMLNFLRVLRGKHIEHLRG